MKVTAAVAVLAVFAASFVRAQLPPSAAGAMGGNCMMDQLSKACPDAKPGSPEFAACSKEHAGDAAAACQGQAQASGYAQARAKTPNAECGDQMQKSCPGLWPGTPEFSKCMNAHEGDFSPSCKAAYEKRKAEHKTMDATCVADSKKYCPGLTVMDKDKYMGCMMKNYDSLSPKCQAKFKGLGDAKKGPHGDCMAAMSTVCPGAITPGHQAIAGTRTPPSR